MVWKCTFDFWPLKGLFSCKSEWFYNVYQAFYKHVTLISFISQTILQKTSKYSVSIFGRQNRPLFKQFHKNKYFFFLFFTQKSTWILLETYESLVQILHFCGNTLLITIEKSNLIFQCYFYQRVGNIAEKTKNSR